MIEISGLSKTYGGKQALDDVSFRAEQGKVTALIGPNGAGKSTLLHILLGLEPASSGAATFDGSRYNELGPSPCNIVGSFIDGLTPHPSRTGLSHLRWIAPGRRRPVLPDATNACGSWGLHEARRRTFKTYSLGMKQRLGIAAAILTDAPYLILDEPLNGLDPEGIQWVRDFIKDYVSDHRTVIVSTVLAELELVTEFLTSWACRMAGRFSMVTSLRCSTTVTAALNRRISTW